MMIQKSINSIQHSLNNTHIHCKHQKCGSRSFKLFASSYAAIAKNLQKVETNND